MMAATMLSCAMRCWWAAGLARLEASDVGGGPANRSDILVSTDSPLAGGDVDFGGVVVSTSMEVSSMSWSVVVAGDMALPVDWAKGGVSAGGVEHFMLSPIGLFCVRAG